MDNFDDITKWIKNQYHIVCINKSNMRECKRIFACAYRIYDETSGSTGGPGGVLHMQEKLMGARFKGIITRYIYRDNDYRVPDDIWSAFNPFSMKTRLVLAGAGYIGTHPEIRESIERGENPLLICHDLGCAFGAYLWDCNYILIYHNQGSILNEIISSGDAATDDDRLVLKEIEKVVIDHCIRTYFPSKGAMYAFMETSQNTWCGENERFSEIPMYNTIDETAYAYAVAPDMLKGALEDDDSLLFLSVGDYIEDKGLDRIPGFLSEYQRQTERRILWIVAGNVVNGKLYESIQRECATYGINHILIDRRIPHEEVLWLMEQCDFYIMFHRKSIFDLATLEAMQMGKKILLSDCISNREFNILDNIVIYENDEVETVKKICSKDDNEWEKQNIRAFRQAFSNKEFIKRYAHEIKRNLMDCGMYRYHKSAVNEKLKIWKNRYAGKTCMICGSGSSLESIQEMDSDCIYIALNRAVFYPAIKYDFVFLQDDPSDGIYTLDDFNLYECVKFYGIITNSHIRVKGLGNQNRVFGHSMGDIFRYELSPNTYDYRVDSLLMDSECDYVPDAQSVLFSAVAMSVFMGFTRIQMCGVDFSGINYGNVINRSRYVVNVCDNLIALKQELKEKRPDIEFGFMNTENILLKEAFLSIDSEGCVAVAASRHQ